MLTMRPPPCARMAGVTARTQFQIPLTLTAITRSHSVSGMSSKRCGLRLAKAAALLTRMSMRPKRRSVSSTVQRTEPASLTSVRTPRTRSEEASFSAAPAGSAMSAMTIRAPSATKRCEYAKPSPLAPPVMTATLSVRRIPSRSVGSDDRLHSASGGGVGEGVLDLRQRELRGDERLDAELRHERQRATEGAAAAERPVDADLAVVYVPQVERQPTALRV